MTLLYLMHPYFKNERKIMVKSFANTTQASVERGPFL
jgi:hypothetical protein